MERRDRRRSVAHGSLKHSAGRSARVLARNDGCGQTDGVRDLNGNSSLRGWRIESRARSCVVAWRRMAWLGRCSLLMVSRCEFQCSKRTRDTVASLSSPVGISELPPEVKPASVSSACRYLHRHRANHYRVAWNAKSAVASVPKDHGSVRSAVHGLTGSRCDRHRWMRSETVLLHTRTLMYGPA